MNLSALMKDLRKIDPKVRVSVKVKRDEGATLIIPVLRRTIRYDEKGNKISDTITNFINNAQYSTENRNDRG